MQEQLSQMDQPGEKAKPVTQVFNQQPNNDNNQSVLLKVNGDMQSTRKIWTLRIIVATVVIFIFLMGLALPPTFDQISNEEYFSQSQPQCNPSTITPPSSLISCQQFTQSNPTLGLLVPSVLPQNQFILYHFQIYVTKQNRESITISQNIDIQIYQVQEIGQQLYARKLIYNNTELLQITKLRKYRREVEEGTGLWKYRVGFAYDRIDQSQKYDYLLLVKFMDFGQLGQIKKITLNAMVVNRNYTIFTIALRAIYCFISLITAVLFVRRYCQLKKQDRIVQIQLIASASVFLVLFNDPFFAITILKVNMVSTFFSTFVVINMLVCLNVLWMFILRRIFQEPDQKKSTMLTIKRSWPFYLVIIALNIAISVFSNQYSFYILKKIPVITSQDFDNMQVIGSIIAIVIILGGIIVYQIFMFVKIVRRGCENGFGLNRHMNFVVYYPFFVCMFVVLFAAGSLMPFSLEGTWVLYGYSFINVYVFLLQYLYYTPSSELQKMDPLIMNEKLSEGQNTAGAEQPKQGNKKQGSIQIQTDMSQVEQNKNL